MKKILTAFAGNSVFANITLATILVSGLVAAMNMVRENFPEFSLDMITISISFPGADPEEIEEGISFKIEEAIENIDGIKQYNTSSDDGFFSAVVELKRGYDVVKVLDNIRTKINSISNLPAKAEKPIIKELMLQDPVILLYISGDASERAIKKLSKQVKYEIQSLPDVSQVKLFGDKEYEIRVEVSEKNLRKYGISLLDIANSISKNNLNLAAGKVRGQHEEVRVRTIGKKYTGEDLAPIRVVTTAGGGFVQLCRLANIKDGFSEDNVEAKIDGIFSELLIVYKTKEEDSLAISDAVSKYVDAKQSVLPDGLVLKTLYDNTDMLRSRIELLIKNGLIGLIIVFLLLWIFLNIRLSFWAGMGIVVSISGALTVLYLLNETVNMVSLFGLIMVLGIVVDDAIVVGESIFYNRQKGASMFDAAVNGVCEVGLPVLTAVATTIVAFMPLFYVGGIMGKFISILPAVVITCLSVSLIESLFLLPAHLSHLPKQIDRGYISSKINWLIYDVYDPFLSKILGWRYVTLSVAIALLFIAVGLVRGGVLKFEVFPAIDGFVMTSTVEFPNGTPLSVTRRAIERIDDALISLANKTQTSSDECLIKAHLLLVGETLDPMPKRGSHLGSVQAILLESEKRGIHSDDLMVLWEKEIGNISGIKSLKFEGLSAGPPGDPIEIWIQGHDINVLLKAADDLMTHLKKIAGVCQVRSDFSLGKNEIHLELKPTARHLGLNVKDLAQQVNAAYYGVEALKVQRNQDDVKIKVCYAMDERNQFSGIDKMSIYTPEGCYVLLDSVADISFSPGYSVIARTDGMRRISVSAGIDAKSTNASEVFFELTNNCFPYLLGKYPEISISPQGEQKKMRESLGSLFIGFPMAVMGIFIIIAATFRSYLQPMVIMLTIPFGIIGAVFGHLALGYDMSIMSIFGMVALTGIVVNDAIVLIERINENLALNMPFFTAVINGSSRRFMAIFLTTISTVGGLAPIIFETDLQAKFLIPMAVSIAFGVAFASSLTLILVPSLLTILSDIRIFFNRIKSGKWEKREILEPARSRQI